MKVWSSFFDCEFEIKPKPHTPDQEREKAKEQRRIDQICDICGESTKYGGQIGLCRSCLREKFGNGR